MSLSSMRAMLAFALLISLPSCSSELDPTDPADAYLLFRNAMIAGDGETVWNRLDTRTHEYFEASHTELEEMAESIERYLPQADHRLARRQSGVILLDDVTDGKSFFLEIFTPQELPQGEAYDLGTRVEEIETTEDGAFAKVITRGGQQFYMVRGDDEQWRVMLLKSSEELKTSMAWLDQNKSALRQTVDDLIAEERQRRETVIAELMKR